jgi:hypothetical protein
MPEDEGGGIALTSCFIWASGLVDKACCCSAAAEERHIWEGRMSGKQAGLHTDWRFGS